MPDTGTSSHFEPCLLVLQEVEDLEVEVADDHIVKCTAREIVEVNMIADDGQPLIDLNLGVILVLINILVNTT